MNVLDVLNSPWAIIPSKLLEIRDIYLSHRNGDRQKSIEAILHRQTVQLDEPSPDIRDGVAIIHIDGVIAKRMNLFHDISGGVSTQLLERDIKQALDNPSVHSLLLNIDSPGGTVDGTPELAQMIFEARGRKPIVAFTDGIIASAAYWIGAAADQVFISGDTVQVGSIGVVATHVDISKAEETAGVKTTEIVAGKFKRVASAHAPLSAEGLETVQDVVNHVYAAFIRSVAESRGVSEDTVLSKMADGRIFIGRDAIEAGLVDGEMSFDRVLQQMQEMKGENMSMGNGTATAQQATFTTQMVIDQYPAIARELRQLGYVEGREAFKAEDYEAALAEGKAMELKRIQDVEAQALPGHEDLIKSLKYDGKTTGEQAAIQVLQKERADKEALANALHDDAPKPVPVSHGTENQDGSATGNTEEAWRSQYAKSADLQNEFVSEQSYLAFKGAEAKGRVKILKK